MLEFTKIIDAMNDFIAHAESGNLKGTLNAIKNAYLAYLEIDKDPETCEEFKQNLNLMYEKILAKDFKNAIASAVLYRTNFEMLLEKITYFQTMKDKGIDLKQMADDMPEFQTMVGSLCYRFWNPDVSENILGLFGMLEALEEGLKGECENQSVDATLESAENYQNDFYISPNKLIGNVKSFMSNFPFIYKARGIKSSLKEFLVTFIHWELVNKLKEAKVSFDLKNSDCFEGALAVALEFGLLYHQEDPEEALKLAHDHRPPTPFRSDENQFFNP